MSDSPPFDPRAVANLLLDALAERGRQATHIDLQKLLYFAHGRFLLGTGEPLVTGYFEAWEYGPVHPAVYQSFKAARSTPINFRALKTNLVTGEQSVVPSPDSANLRRHIEVVTFDYGQLSTRQLIDLSHATNGPWDLTIRKLCSQLTLGARIPNDVIKFSFQRHKIDIGLSSRSGGPLQDAPLTRNRSRQYGRSTTR
jgi:uncharacterized phage-associated protein